MKIIGLCGGSGSGKSFASKCFELRSIPTLNTDELYHSMIEQNSECALELIGTFGPSIRKENGGIDRKKLAEIVFAQDKSKLKLLDEISHRHILNECRKWIRENEKSGKKAVIIDAPLLFEAEFDKECDIIISVIAPKNLRLERIIKRDGMTRDMAEKRIKAQKSDEFLIKNSDYVIENYSSPDELDLQVERICSLILK